MDIKKLQKHLGLRLKELRQAKGFKQEDLENYGFSYRHYGKLERGEVNPTLETLVRLAKIFEISLSDLFVFMESNKTSTNSGQTISLKIAELLKEGDETTLRKLHLFLHEIL